MGVGRDDFMGVYYLNFPFVQKNYVFVRHEAVSDNFKGGGFIICFGR